MTDNFRFFLGFTGTRQGMSKNQKFLVNTIVEQVKHNYKKVFALHGDCIGADEEFHEIVSKHGLISVSYPPINDSYRAFTVNKHEQTPMDYLERDRWIVHDTHLLIGCPYNTESVRGSGTWYTIGHAKKTRKDHTIILRDGRTETIRYEQDQEPDSDYFTLC